MSEDRRAQPTALEIREKRQRRTGYIVQRCMDVAAKHITAERLTSIVLGAFVKTPKLEQCTDESLFLALMTCAQYGLEPSGPQGHAYLIPYGSECTLILGYRGLAELARRSGEIRSMDARVIYAGEDASIEAGSDGIRVRHTISLTVDRSGITPKNAAERLIGAYATVTTKDGATYCEFITVGQIEERRKRGGSGKGSKTPWDTDYVAMARKSALRALLGGGLVPMSAEILNVVERDEPEAIDAEDVRQLSTTPRTLSALGSAQQIEAPPPTVMDAADLAQRVAASEPLAAVGGDEE